MRNLNGKILLLTFLVWQTVNTVFSKDLTEKILDAINSHKSYEMVFERMFKYPNEEDTLGELYTSTVCLQSDGSHVGTHIIGYLRSGSLRSLVAADNEAQYRYNSRENMYRSAKRKTSGKNWKGIQEQVMYFPFTRTEAEWRRFRELGREDGLYILERKDSGRNKSGAVIWTSVTKVKVTAQYIPVLEETVTYSGSKMQYSQYRLRSLSKTVDPGCVKALKKADSLIAVIRKFPDADSVRQQRSAQYKKVRPGDTAAVLTGKLSGQEGFSPWHKGDSILVLDFFYTTCAPCVTAVPEMNELTDSFRNRGVGVYGVIPFESDWGNIPGFRQKTGARYPILETGKDVVHAYGVTGYPRMFIVKNGVIMKIYYGYTRGGIRKDVAAYLKTLIY